MKLKIEDWISENKFSNDVNVLLLDSCKCYKAGAYRASLLFSYLGFMTILKIRIIKANKPQNYIQGEWDALIKKLKNEDKWEEGVFDSTQQLEKVDQLSNTVKKDAVLVIKEELRGQIKYWKNRRNDCAHFKDNNIDYFHVESFWAFMESNLPKITVEGGVNSLINRITDHFNPILTPPDKDFTYLVNDIEHSVEPTKLKDFWGAFMIHSTYSDGLSVLKKSFLNECFKVCSETVVNSLIVELNQRELVQLDFFDNYPEIIIRFNLTPQNIRKLWSKGLYKAQNTLGIYATLLRNGLVPNNEIEEANASIINLIIDNNPRYSPSKLDHHTLETHRFYDTLKTEVFNRREFTGYKSYLWVNQRADLIVSVMKFYPVDKEVILKISKHYEQSQNSDWLLERFENSLVNNDKFIDDYRALVQSEGIDLPAVLTKFFK
jgi:hypothetical protein